jgi:gliding motility-associated-like protein
MKFWAITLFFAVTFGISTQLNGQTINYSQGGLQVSVFVSNPCNGSSNGFIRFTVTNTADAQPARLQIVLGPVNFFGPQSIPVGGSFTFNGANTLSAGLYNFIIADNTGTDVINTFPASGVTLTALPNLVANEVSRINNTDCATPNGQVVASISGGSQALGGGGSYTYTWTSSNGLTGLPLTNNNFNGLSNLDLATLLSRPGLPGGTYTLTIQDNYSSCTIARNFTLNDPLPNLYSITSGSGTACSGSNFTITLNSSDGPTPLPGASYEILRNGSPTGLIFPGTGSGPFNMVFPTTSFSNGDVLTVRATNGFCTPRIMTGSVTLGIASSPTAAVLSGTATICSGQSTNLSVAIAGGTAPFTFTITGFGLVSGYASGAPISVSPTTTTNYTLSGTVTDANGCTVAGTGTASVTVNPTPTASISATPTTICAGASSTLTFNLTGTGPFNVSYSDGSSSFNLSGISNGHTVIVTPPVTRTYTITGISDASSCIGAAGSNVTITVNPPPTSAILSGTATICAGQSTNLAVNIVGGTPPFSFNLAGVGAIGGYTSGSGIAVSPLVTTSYSITGNVTDANGCTVAGTGTATVTVNPVPVATVAALPAAVCAGGSSTLTFTLTGTAPFNVSYSDGVTTFNLTGISSGHTVSVTPTATTVYTITNVSDATTCVGLPGANTTVTVNPSPTAAVLSGTTSICAGGTANLVVNITSGTGPFSFNITGIGAITGYTSGDNIPVSPASTTNYTLSGTVTDAAGCTVAGTGSALVTVNPVPVASISATPTTLCSSGSSTLTFTLVGTAPFNVTYTDGVTNFNLIGISSGHTVSVTPTVNTTYTITAVTDATTCAGAAGANATVSVNPAPASAVLSGTATICSGQSTNLIATITGGVGPYNLTIAGVGLVSGYISGAPIAVSPTSTTNYSITGLVTDANGCTVAGTGSATVTVNPLPTAVISGGGNVCFGSPLPNVVFTFTGTTPFTFTWTDGTTPTTVTNHPSTTFTIPTAPAGTYSVTALTDANGCVATNLGAPVPVTVSTAITSAVLSGNATICNGQTTNLVVNITGGTGPYSFTITGLGLVSGYNSGANIPVNPSVTTNYSLSGNVTDALGCLGAGSGAATVTISPAPTGSIAAAPATICAGATANLTFTLAGSGPFNVAYSDGASTFNLTGINNGHTASVSPTATTTYTITSITDATSCPGIISGAPATITVSPTITAATLSGNATICAGGSSNLSVNIVGGTAPYSFTIAGVGLITNYNSGSPILAAPSTTTNYTILGSVTDASGCTVAGSGSATITVNPIPTSIAPGVDTWIGDVFDDATNSSFPYQNGVDFANSKYRGYLTETDIAGIGSSTYNTATDAFDLNFGVGAPLAGPNICGSYLNRYSIRLQMNKNFASAGVYTFNLSSDDGVRFYVDGVLQTLSPGNAFSDHGYLNFSTAGICLSAGNHNLVIEYYENGGASRLTFGYSSTPTPVTSVSVSGPASAICAGTTVTFTAVPSNGGATPAFQWKKNGTNVGINSFTYSDNALVNGDAITVELTSSLACASPIPAISAPLTVTVNPTPSAPVVASVTYCQNITAVALTATGSNLLWYTTATGGTGSGTAPVPSTGLPGTTPFFVSQTVSGCESARAQLDVIVTPAPANPTVTNVAYCVGDVGVPLNAIGTNLLWYTTATGGVGNPVAPAPSTGGAGVTSFFVSQTVSGCESGRAQLDVTVSNPPNVGLALASAITNLCTGGATTIDVAGSQSGVTYQLRIGTTNVGAAVAGGGTISLATGVLTTTTTFNVLATNTNGSCPPQQLTATATVNVGGTINAGLTIAPLAASICTGSSTSIRISTSETGVTYQLRNSANSNIGPSAAGNGGDLDLPTGVLSVSETFNVLATSATCSVVMTTLPSVSVVTGPDNTRPVSGPASSICPNTATNITVSNSEIGVSYQLRSGTTNIGAAQNGNGSTLTFNTGNVASPTTFNVLATASGCPPVQLVATAAVSLLPSGDPSCGGGGGINCGAFTISVTDTRPTCSNQNNGQIIITVSGGSPNYVVTLSDASLGYNRALVGAGPFVFGNPSLPTGGLSPSLNYQYTVLDQAGNTCTQPYSLPVQSTVQATASTFIDAQCNGQAVGSARITITSGGTPPYEYSVDGGTTYFGGLVSGNTINNLPPNGTYNILVRDNAADQCPATVSVTINNANTPILATVTSSNATCANNDGFITVSGISGGVGPYTFQLDGNPVTLATGGRINNLAGGNYIVSVVDAQSCQRDFPVTVVFPGFVVTTTPVVTPPDCAGQGVNGTIGFSILSSGTFTVGYTTDPINQPTVFVDYGTPNILLQGLATGDYYIWIKPNTAACATKLAKETVTGSFTQVSLDAPILSCVNGAPEIRISNIKAAAGPFTIQLTKKGQTIPDRTIALSTIPAGALYIIRGTELPSTKGDYTINIVQTQASCSISSATFDVTYNGMLAVQVANLKSSYPDLPTGGFDLIDFLGGTQPYAVTIRFDSAANPQVIPTDFTPRTEEVTELNNALQYVKSYKALHAGRYRLTVTEKDGCALEFDVRVPLDFVFDPNTIPNVFTPNDDGANDTFFIRNIPPGTQVNISSRWGAEVYSSKDYQNDWTGSNYPDGVYFYRINAAGNTFTGWVEIIRGK